MDFMHRGVRLTLLIALAASAAPLHAQQWKLGVQAGRMRSALDPAEASSSIALGLRYDALDAGFRISAGIPTGSADALWAGTGLWKRAALRAGGFLAGIDVMGNAFMTRDRSHTSAPTSPGLPGPFDPPLEPVADMSGYALAGQAMPVIGYERARFQLHARAGVSHYRASFGDVATDRTVRLADVQLTVAPVSSFALVPVVRRHWAEGEDAATYAGVSAIIAGDVLGAWGSIGHWVEPETELPWAAGASLRMHDRIELEASARRDVFDPLYLQPPQTSWTIGLSVRVGGAPATVAPPVPHEYEDGRATIRLPISESEQRPSIAGDFNGWKPAPMRRDGDAWVYTLALTPGVYNYAFVAADGTWFVPESVPGRKDDGMGGHVAVLVVS